MNNPYGFPQNVNDQSRIGGAVFRRLFGVLNAQLQGAFDALLPPVLPQTVDGATPDDTSITAREAVIWGLEVTHSGGLQLRVARGAALAALDSSDALPARVYVRSTGGTVTIEGEGTWFVYAAPVRATEPFAPDSRENGLATFVVRDEEAEDGAVLLAEASVVEGVLTLTDRRTFTAAEALRQRVAQLEDDLGYTSTARLKGKVAERLARLEGPASGDTPNNVPLKYLSQLQYSAADTRPANEVIEEKLLLLEAKLMLQIASGGQRPQQTSLDQITHEHAITRQEAGKTQYLLRRLVEELQVSHPDVQLPVEIGLNRSQSANVLGTSAHTPVYGHNNPSTPEYLGPTSLTPQPDGSLEP